MTIQQIEAEVLSLPTEDRARIAEVLIASLDPGDEIEKAWDAEVARRWAEIESGTVQAIPGDAVLAKLCDALR